MHDKKPPTFAFVGWNSFQMLRFKELARALPGSVLVVEKRPGQRCEIADELLTSLDPPVLVWESRRMRELDGVFDVVVCQTLFGQIEQFERSKIAMLQYGLAKEPHNHGPWRALADLCLVYGPYTAEKISHLCPVAQVGNPHFDAWQTPAFHEAAKRRFAKSLDPSKKTILYVPTWGPLSTQDEFMGHVEELADEYNVLVKLHHNTALLEHERTSLTTNRHVQYFGSDDDLLELLVVTDLAISDYSGAIFDALYCRKPVVLLQTRSAERFGTKLDQDSIEYSQRHRVGPVVDSPSALRPTVRAVFSGAVSFQAKNGALIEELFVPGARSAVRGASALQALASVRNLAKNPQQMQLRANARKPRPKAVFRIERMLLDYLFRARLPQLVLPYVELRVRIRPALYLYRAGVRAAQQQGFRKRALKLSRAARRAFPESNLEIACDDSSDDILSRRKSARLAISEAAMRRHRNVAGAYQILTRAQRHQPGHPRLLLALAELLLDERKPLQANTYRLLGGLHTPVRKRSLRPSLYRRCRGLFRSVRVRPPSPQPNSF